MFERFTDRSRRVLVLAQEEARLLDHGFIGTEHVLLGLAHEGEGVAAQALVSLGVTLEGLRHAIAAAVGDGPSDLRGAAPTFTPQAKGALELALREALGFGAHEIGTEHLLLGVVSEGEGVAVEVLAGLGVPPDRVREAVLSRVVKEPGHPGPPDRGAETARVHGMVAGGPAIGRLVPPPRASPVPVAVDRCILCQQDLWEVAHYVAAGPVRVCGDCIRAAAELLDEAAPGLRQLPLPPRVFGDVPGEHAVGAIVEAVEAAFGGRADRDLRAAAVEDPPELELFFETAERLRAQPEGARVSRVRFVAPDLADIRFHVALRGEAEVAFDGRVRHSHARWAVTRETVARVLDWVRARPPSTDA